MPSIALGLGSSHRPVIGFTLHTQQPLISHALHCTWPRLLPPACDWIHTTHTTATHQSCPPLHLASAPLTGLWLDSHYTHNNHTWPRLLPPACDWINTTHTTTTIQTSSNTRFLGSTRVHNTNGISIGSTVQGSQLWQTAHAAPFGTTSRTYIVLRCCLIITEY